MDILIADDLAAAILQTYEDNIGTSPIIRFYGSTAGNTATVPTSVTATLTGVVAATIQCQADWLAPAVNREAAFQGSVQDPSADAAVDALVYFVVFASDGTTPKLVGDITTTGGGGKLTVSSLAVALGQPINITGLKLTR